MSTDSVHHPDPHMVLYCLIRKKHDEDDNGRFLLMEKQGQPTFPCTKLRAEEDLYQALARPLEEDLGLPADSYYLEEELVMIPSAGESPRYPGLGKEWFLYPVVLSYAPELIKALSTGGASVYWWTLEEMLSQAKEPNVLAIARFLQDKRSDLVSHAPHEPSMDARARQWAANNDGGVRVVRKQEITQILRAGSRAFNLRVADPYLPYQKQGLGFTWSFFTPKDKQDLHVHGLPAVEIYGVMEGTLLLCHKPMDQRGARTWQCKVLHSGDWAELEPLQCHFACWLEPEGFGTVIKAASTGELAGVGRLGVSGKTTCTWKERNGLDQNCGNFGECAIPPMMQDLIQEYGKSFEQRDYQKIREWGKKILNLNKCA